MIGVKDSIYFRNYWKELNEIICTFLILKAQYLKVRICITGRYMKKIMNEQLIYEILSVVEEIPKGKVATYGQIARLIGRDKNARLVGKVLSQAEFYGRYPCHRVVNHAGRLAPGWQEQRFLLLEEGVYFKDGNHVDMKKNQWDC
ncbi:MAG: putative methylated DNA-protein cysteine methyltransferase [Clostridium sp. Maddingley MBC34-26]|nr:MAG: putative methylated DNA-protein cysteine methyltransferase [Clostridium sp. Maddingley MBC34-26]